MSAAPRISLLKRAWHEIPEVMGSTFMGLIGIGMGFTALYIYDQKNLDNRRYKFKYTVYRDTDPRAATVRKD